jgi:hypothetical protein
LKNSSGKKPLVRAELVSLFIVTKTSKKGKVHKYWHCSWRIQKKEPQRVPGEL